MQHVLTVEGNQYLPLGVALTQAKVNHPGESSDHINVNLLGDPMMSVPRPPRQVRITKINGDDADVFDGTLRALDFVEIEGEVLDESGSMRDSSFNEIGRASCRDGVWRYETSVV